MRLPRRTLAYNRPCLVFDSPRTLIAADSRLRADYLFSFLHSTLNDGLLETLHGLIEAALHYSTASVLHIYVGAADLLEGALSTKTAAEFRDSSETLRRTGNTPPCFGL